MKQRLDKWVSHAFGLPRKQARGVVRSGRVTVHGEVCTDPGAAVHGDELALDSHRAQPQIDVALFHKPLGVQCTVGDPMGRLSLSEAASELLEQGLHPVGRLDADTSGLLLFVRDGQLTQRLLHPRRGVAKTYRATVQGQPDHTLVAALTAGVQTALGTHTATVSHLEDDQVTLAVTEGKHRMVRRMLFNCGYPVAALHRLEFGPFILGDLPSGQWREASTCELAALSE